MSMILNPYRYAGAGGGPTFGNASREFDGAGDYVTIAGDVDDKMTLSIWFKDLSGGTDTSTCLISQHGVTNPRWPFWINGANVIFQPISDSGNRTYSAAHSSAFDGNWHHFAVSWDTGGSVAIYQNGSSILSTTSTLTQSLASNPNPMRIGLMNIFGTESNARYADARVYDVALTAGDIADIYGGTHVSTGIVGWWLTDSDDVLDYSGNGNDGTNFGSTYSTDGPFD